MHVSRFRGCFGFLLMGLLAAFMTWNVLLRTQGTLPVNKFSLPLSERYIKRLSSLTLYNRSGFTGYGQFFDYIENPAEHLCSNKEEFGGAIMKWRKPFIFPKFKLLSYKDGNKMVCLEKELFGGKNDCLVVSIGIGRDWSFDDAIASYGCQVFAFDHTIYKNEHTRKGRIYFYPYGIAVLDKKTKKGKLITLSSMLQIIKKRMNKTEVTINYLKIDVEGSEMEFFEYILHRVPEIVNMIKQIGMEIHPGRIIHNNKLNIYKKYFQYFMELEVRGFTLIYSAMNPVPGNRYYFNSLKKQVNGYYELVWGKLE